MKNGSIFIKFIIRSLWHRKLHSIVAILTIVLGTGIIGGLVNVYSDLNGKMSKEFRAFGANILIYPAEQNAQIPSDTLAKITRNVPQNKRVGMAPIQYGLVQVEGDPVVLAGTWLDQMKYVSPYWQVKGGWIDGRDNMSEAMVGVAVAKKYDAGIGDTLRVTNKKNGTGMTIKIKGIVTTGGAEDNQIFVGPKLAQRLTEKTGTDIVLLSLLENGTALEKDANKLQSTTPGIVVKPLKQLIRPEEKVLQKIQQLTYFIAVFIFITTVLTVTISMITMMISRRKEVGLKKALGASDQKLMTEFLAEGGIIGLIGSAVGILFANYFARLIGELVFNAEITFRAVIIPWIFLVSFMVIGIGFTFSVRKMIEIEPAVILKGE